MASRCHKCRHLRLNDACQNRVEKLLLLTSSFFLFFLFRSIFQIYSFMITRCHLVVIQRLIEQLLFRNFVLKSCANRILMRNTVVSLGEQSAIPNPDQALSMPTKRYTQTSTTTFHQRPAALCVLLDKCASHRDPEGEPLLKYPPVYKLHPCGNETEVAPPFFLSFLPFFPLVNKSPLERITVV